MGGREEEEEEGGGTGTCPRGDCFGQDRKYDAVESDNCPC